MAAVGDHYHGVHGLLGGFLGGEIEGGAEVGGIGGGIVVGAENIAPVVAGQGEDVGSESVAFNVGAIGHVLEPGILGGVEPAGHLVVSGQFGFQGQAGLVLGGGILFVGRRELDRLALDALAGGGDESRGFIQAVFGRFAGGLEPRTHGSGVVLEKGGDALHFGAGLRVGAGNGREQGSQAGGGGVNGLVNLVPERPGRRDSGRRSR